MIEIAQPMIGPEEVEAVVAVLQSGRLAQGDKVAELERAFAVLCGTDHAVAVNSGTAALHVALHAAGVGPGDEVIVPAFSFVGTANPVLMQGARPVFVDIGSGDFNIDPDLIERAVGPKTKAIIAVDLYGQPYDHDAVARVAAAHRLRVVEDACQAAGAEYKGRPAGSLGDFGCVSLYATKNVTAGEGGVMTTGGAREAAAARSFRQHGLTENGGYRGYGYNYRSTEMAAAIAVEQLKKLAVFTAARQRNAGLLSAGLAGIRGLVLPRAERGRSHVYHQYTLRVTPEFGPGRDELAARLAASGVASGVYYKEPLPALPHLGGGRYRAGDFPAAEQAAREVLSLPVHPGVSGRDVDTIVRAVKAISPMI